MLSCCDRRRDVCLQVSEEDGKARSKLSHHQIDCPTVGKIDVFVQASTIHCTLTHSVAHLLTRQWCIAGSAPSTHCAIDSSSFGARRRLGHNATSTMQQGR